jgi:hypothetical protein
MKETATAVQSWERPCDRPSANTESGLLKEVGSKKGTYNTMKFDRKGGNWHLARLRDSEEFSVANGGEKNPL